MVYSSSSANAGSSPLTRGKRTASLQHRRIGRLIPAHAGKTRRGTPIAPSRPAHPRSRGENDHENVLTIPQKGSSPLTRGKPAGAASPDRRRRLIPAHAGKTESGGDRSGDAKAHPRSRGENTERPCEATRRQGSSPLTRGKPRGNLSPPDARRLIPAHAGKTSTCENLDCQPMAHPRSRGENRDGVIDRLSIGGSSPLTRGKHPRGRVERLLRRLIPAHAGKT